jgi:predicted DNA-binding protein
MSNTKQVNYRLPLETLELINKLSKELNLNNTQVVVQAIELLNKQK